MFIQESMSEDVLGKISSEEVEFEGVIKRCNTGCHQHRGGIDGCWGH